MTAMTGHDSAKLDVRSVGVVDLSLVIVQDRTGQEDGSMDSSFFLPRGKI